MPSTATQPDEPLSELAGFFVLTNRISSRVQNSVDDAGEKCSIGDWLLLHAVNGGESGSMSDVARKVGVSRQRVHQQATALQEAKLLTVVSAPEGKGRSMSLTSEGKTALKKADTAIASMFKHSDDFSTKVQGARKAVARLSKAIAPQHSPEED